MYNTFPITSPERTRCLPVTRELEKVQTIDTCYTGASNLGVGLLNANVKC